MKGFLRTRRPWLAAVLSCLSLSACTQLDSSGRDQLEAQGGDLSAVKARPNIMLIVADDLAYSDLGVFGGEIGTPNIDTLAKAGFQLTNFYTAPTCSPTRSMLLTGTDNHLAGIGAMVELMAENQKGKKGYEGHLNSGVVTLPELLSDAGYHTYMVGKWHLGHEEQTSPAARGFHKSFSLDQGGAGHFNDLPIIGPKKATFREDGKITNWPEGRYSTEFYTEKVINYIKADQDDDNPFFAYVAYTAPHFPLQAPAESIAKYKGAYDEGYETLASQRLERMKELGIIPEAVAYQSHWAPRWHALSKEEKEKEARKMEIYAAMVSDLDRYIGELIDFLKATGEFENTLIVFMSDNGAEGHNFPSRSQVGRWAEICCDNSFENMGNSDSYLWYGSNWAQAGAAPYSKHKGYTAEGGIKAPALIHYGAMAKENNRLASFTTVLDFMPSLLEVAGVSPPGQSYKGRKVHPLLGESLIATLRNEKTSVHSEEYYMGWEFVGRRAIRQGDWKLHWRSDEFGGRWHLFNMRRDPTEQHDLLEKEKQVSAKLIALWEHYVEETGVILPDGDSVY